MSQLIGPGSTIGILGAGQLGRMLAIVARRMGYRIAVYGGNENSPAGQVSDLTWAGDYDNDDELQQFASAADVVTYEFENVPSAAAAKIAELTPLRPGVELLNTAQNRFREKTALAKIGLPTAGFCLVRSAQEIRTARDQFGGSAILKANTDGYDGKGQWSIDHQTDVDPLWAATGLSEAIVEQRITFEFELSVVAGRYADGTTSFFHPLLNHHANHILDVTVSGAPEVSDTIAANAIEMARAVLEHFDVVGVLCIELFLTSDGRLIVNEIAPRPHNSGHLTIEAYNCSQFELQLRTICGLPPVRLVRRCPIAAMSNLLGQHLPATWTESSLIAFSGEESFLHLYGKPKSRRDRKMGHITVTGNDPEAAEQIAREARSQLLAR